MHTWESITVHSLCKIHILSVLLCTLVTENQQGRRYCTLSAGPHTVHAVSKQLSTSLL